MRNRTLGYSLALSVSMMTSGSAIAAEPATPPEVAQCVENHVKAQALRRDAKLVEAREKLVACSRSCPSVVASDCIRWLEEVENLIPSIIVRAKSGTNDVIDARLLIDDKVVATRLEGREMSLNPGPHRVRIETGEGQEQKDVLLVAGEQGRSVVFKLGKSEEPAREEPKATAPIESRPIPAYVFVTGGLAVAALGIGTSFAVLGKSDENDLLNSCAPDCTQGQFDDLQTRYRIANVGFGVAAVSAVATVVLYLTRPRAFDSPPTGKSSGTAFYLDAKVDASGDKRQIVFLGKF